MYPVNPKLANQLRSVAGAKTDQIDAHLLAQLGRLKLAELRRLEPDGALVQELKTLTRDQDALIQMQTRLVNQLTACLKEYYPAALHLFAKLQQHSTLVFLQAYPTPQAAGSSCFGGRDPCDLADGQAHESQAGGDRNRRGTASPSTGCQPGHGAHQVALDALPGQTIAGRH